MATLFIELELDSIPDVIEITEHLHKIPGYKGCHIVGDVYNLYKKYYPVEDGET